MTSFPVTVVADSKGRITDLPELAAAGRSGRAIYPIDPAQLIPLPESSRLYLLPGRRALGFDAEGTVKTLNFDRVAVAAFLPPGYVALSLAAFEARRQAPRLPLFCYCAVCWYRGGFHVPAFRVDHDPRHDPSRFNMKEVCREVRRRIRQSPRNRLIAHHGLVCVGEYGCPNAANLFLQRWEAPVAVSGGCNASCLGCISKQEGNSIPSPQSRIGFVPTVDEIVELAVPHLKKAPRAMISFGQGCEGEPLLKGDLIEAAIREIRKRTKRGVIHINTNGSMPGVVERLASAGLDSIRISLNSARPSLYAAYYRCRAYSFDDVLASFHIAHEAGMWTSINYLTFPGVTDDPAECRAFTKMLEKTTPHMIQWRNLNIDPGWYMDTVDRACPPKPWRRREQSRRDGLSGDQAPMGLKLLMRHIRSRHPKIRFGYFNCVPPV